MDLIPVTRLIQKYKNKLNYRFLNMTYNNQYWNSLLIEHPNIMFDSDRYDEDDESLPFLNIEPNNNDYYNFSKYVPYMINVLVKQDRHNFIYWHKEFNYLFNSSWINDTLIKKSNNDFATVVMDFMDYENFSLVKRIIKLLNINLQDFEGDISRLLNHFSCPKSYIKFMYYYDWNIKFADDTQILNWYDVLEEKINKMVYCYIVEEFGYKMEDEYMTDGMIPEDLDLKFVYFIIKRNYENGYQMIEFCINETKEHLNFVNSKKYIKKDNASNESKEQCYTFVKMVKNLEKEILSEYKNIDEFKRLFNELGY